MSHVHFLIKYRQKLTRLKTDLNEISLLPNKNFWNLFQELNTSGRRVLRLKTHK
jgi:hypothetical protein